MLPRDIVEFLRSIDGVTDEMAQQELEWSNQAYALLGLYGYKLYRETDEKYTDTEESSS